jgi:hypothetical protein
MKLLISIALLALEEWARMGFPAESHRPEAREISY